MQQGKMGSAEPSTRASLPLTPTLPTDMPHTRPTPPPSHPSALWKTSGPRSGWGALCTPVSTLSGPPPAPHSWCPLSICQRGPGTGSESSGMSEGARDKRQPRHPMSRELKGGGTLPRNGPGLGPGEDRCDGRRRPELQERGDAEALTDFMCLPNGSGVLPCLISPRRLHTQL